MDDNEQTAKLRAHIQSLSDLRIQIQKLRQLPTSLLKVPGNENLLLPDNAHTGTGKLRNEFSELRSIVEKIRSAPVQEALTTARERLEADGADLKPRLRHENRKRRGEESFPKSPEPYVSTADERKIRKFPLVDPGVADFEGIYRYIRDSNSRNEAKLHLWRQRRQEHAQASIPEKIVVRFTIKDVLTAYMTLVNNSEKKLVVESVTAFGPREKKGPHCESEYGVYRLLSQQMAQMLEGEGIGIENVLYQMKEPYQLLYGNGLTMNGLQDTLGAEIEEYPKMEIPPSVLYSTTALSKFDPMATPAAFDQQNKPKVLSENGIIHVLGYTPAEGEPGTPISARVHFHPDFADAIYVRLVLGNKAVATTVREMQDTAYGKWQLDALAPPFDNSQFPSTKVPISVQALDQNNKILDSVTFGEFSYWTPGISPFPVVESATRMNHKKLSLPTSIDHAPEHVAFRRRSSQIPTPSPTSTNHSRLRSASGSSSKPASFHPGSINGNPQQPNEVQLHRRTKTDTMLRHKNGKHNINPHIQTPILQLATPLANICAGWSTSEVAVGRRLVRFTKVQDGCRLIVSCEPIKAEDYQEADSVISCIYREESESCYVTSVDIIFLLERLTNSDFPVEEKNRIRRNLEGLRPTTVSKHKPGFEQFFQRIMEFPDPKPRNIEKDLKVFEWGQLDQALDKILSKYTIDVSAIPRQDSSHSSQVPSPASSAGSSEDAPGDYDPTCPPSVNPEDSYLDELHAAAAAAASASSSSLPSRYEDDFAFLASSDSSEILCSPLDGAAPVSFPFYDTELMPPPHTPISASAPAATSGWAGAPIGTVSDFEKATEVMIEHYNQYGEIQHHGNSPAVMAYDLDFGTPYETLTPFHGSIPPEAMDITDHPYL